MDGLGRQGAPRKCDAWGFILSRSLLLCSFSQDVLAALTAAVDAATSPEATAASSAAPLDLDVVAAITAAVASRALSLARPGADDHEAAGQPSTSGAVACGVNPEAGGLGSALALLASLAPSTALVLLARAGVEALEACARPPPTAPREVRAALAASALPGLDLATAALARLAEEAGGGGGGSLPADGGGDASANPTAVTAAALARICRAPTWPAPAARAVEALRALPALTAAQAGAIADRALAECAGLQGDGQPGGRRPAAAASGLGDLSDLPAVLHQLLLLRPAAGARAALAGAVDLLDAALGVDGAPHTTTSSATAATAATVVLEAERAAAAAPDTARGWLAGLAARAGSGPHGAAVLLAIASGVPRLAVPALDELRACLARAYKADGVRAASRWGGAAPRPMPASFPSSSALEGALMAVAGGRAAGWERGLPAVLVLVDALVDGVADKAAVPGEGGGEEMEEADETAADLAPPTRAGRLGVRLAVAAFGAAPSPTARAQILHLCIARLASTGVGSAGSGAPAASITTIAVPAAAAPPLCGKLGHWVSALRGMASTHAADLGAHHAGSVRAALELCGALPAPTSCALLAALWPACRTAGVRDAAALSLRKAAFSREATSRAAAARGMLALSLHELKVPAMEAAPSHLDAGAGPSQAPVAPQPFLAPPANASGLSALKELTGFLRRCLSQQAVVRSALYEGVPTIVEADAGAAAEALAGLLLPQLTRVAPAAVVGAAASASAPPPPPLRLDLAIVRQGEAGATTIEPLPGLLACVRRVCLLAGAGAVEGKAGISGPHGRAAARLGAGLPARPPHPPRPGGAVDALAAAFAAVKAAVLLSVAEDYSLDKAADWGGGGGGAGGPSSGAATRARAAALMGVLEVLMEDALAGAAGGGVPPGEAGDQLTAAFRLHDRVRELSASAGASAAAPARGELGAPATKKRGRTDAALTPSHPLPSLTPWAVDTLLNLAVEDRMPEPGGGRGVAQDNEGGGGPGPSTSQPPVPSALQLSLEPGARLAREPRFQAFVLRVARAVVAWGAGSGDGGAVAARAAIGPPLLAAACLVASAYSTTRGGGHGGGGGGGGAPLSAAASSDDHLCGLAVDAAVALLDAPASRAELRRLVEAAGGGGGGGGGGVTAPPGADDCPVTTSPPPPLPPSSWLHAAAAALDRLVGNGCWKEGGAWAEGLARLARRPGVLSAGGRAVLRAAAEGGLGAEGAAGPAARGLAALLLATSPGDDAADALRLVDAAVGALKAASQGQGGDAPDAPGQPAAAAFPAITARTAGPVAGVALDHALAALADADWAFATARAASRTTAAAPPSTQRLMVGGGSDGGTGSSPATAALAAAGALDEAACARVGALLPPIAAVAAGGLCSAAPRLADKALRSVLAAYRSLSAAAARTGEAAKAGGGGGGRPPPSLSPAFLSMVATAHKTLTPAAYTLIFQTENAGGGGGNAGGGAASAAAAGGRAPAVVFAAEDFERRLIRLGSTGGCGAADLLRGARRATARDFRITLGAITGATGGGGDGAAAALAETA